MNNAVQASPHSYPLLRVQNLVKTYTGRGGLLQRGSRVPALQHVSFSLEEGKTLGIAGGSGSGKSTLARCVSRMERPDSGEVVLEGRDLACLSLRELRPIRPAIQMMFQDAATAMNPRLSAEEIIAEPLLIQRVGSAAERAARVREAMEGVGLPADWSARSAHEFSGGQRQRLTLARALALKPRVLILDEPLTGLDISTRAQMANLLLEVQAAHGLGYLLISHDLGILAHLADRIAIMSAGRFVEEGPAREIMSHPQHRETKKLLAAAGRQALAAEIGQ
jgi:peptide/nickel transport system ATP-binding protein/oligopeptide transport system ATP-binding protein